MAIFGKNKTHAYLRVVVWWPKVKQSIKADIPLYYRSTKK